MITFLMTPDGLFSPKVPKAVHPMRIYVASSWRNAPRARFVVDRLRAAGHTVFDFTRPEGVERGFSWKEVDPHWAVWDNAEFITGLGHPAAQVAFARDMTHLTEADATVLVMPCGRSAHLELGVAAGMKQWTIALLDPNAAAEAELMLGVCDLITEDLDAVVRALHDVAPDARALRKVQ